MDKDLFDDLIASCNEAIEHEKGNIKLKSTVLTLPPDEERETVSKFYNLSEKNKHIATVLINELYQQREA